MLSVVFKSKKELLITKSLNRLVHSAIFKHLPSSEHDGYKSKISSKLFKSFTFKAIYKDKHIYFNFSSIFPENEQKVANAILFNKFEIGSVEIIDKELNFKELSVKTESIKIRGAITVKIKDIRNKALYLSPLDSRFYTILEQNIKERFETFCDSNFEPIKIDLIKTLKPITLYYNSNPFAVTPCILNIQGRSDILEFILKAGIGSNSSKGFGMVELIE